MLNMTVEFSETADRSASGFSHANSISTGSRRSPQEDSIRPPRDIFTHHFLIRLKSSIRNHDCPGAHGGVPVLLDFNANARLIFNLQGLSSASPQKLATSASELLLQNAHKHICA